MNAEDTTHPDAEPRGKQFLSPHAGVWGLVVSLGVVVCCATVAGFLGRFWWRLDLASHFRVQYAVALLCVTLLLLAGRNFRPALVFAVFLVANLATIVPPYFGGTGDAGQNAATLRVMLINVHCANRNSTPQSPFSTGTRPGTAGCADRRRTRYHL